MTRTRCEAMDLRFGVRCELPSSHFSDEDEEARRHVGVIVVDNDLVQVRWSGDVKRATAPVELQKESA